uniref:BHLH domain-containing protein n=1 Tax=Trichuris muris TaxID=70415 RepID=A0A5S6QRV3_TRIMR
MNGQSQYFMFHGAERQTPNAPASTQLTAPGHPHQPWNDWYRNCVVDAAAAAFPFSMGNDRSAATQLLLPNFYSGFPQQTVPQLTVKDPSTACQSSFPDATPLHGMMRAADIAQSNNAMSGLVQRSAGSFTDGTVQQPPLPSTMYFPTQGGATPHFCSTDPSTMGSLGAAPSSFGGINSSSLDSQAATMVAQAAALANHCSTNFYGAATGNGGAFFGGLPHQANAVYHPPAMALASKPKQSPCLGVSSVVHHHPHPHHMQQQPMMTHAGSTLPSVVNPVDANNGTVQVAYPSQSSVRSLPYGSDSFEPSKAHQGVAIVQGYPSPVTHYAQQQQLSASPLDAHLQSSFLKGSYLQQSTSTPQQTVVLSQRNVANSSIPVSADPTSTCHLATDVGHHQLHSFSSQNIAQQQHHADFLSSMGQQQCFQRGQCLPNSTAVRMNETGAYKQFAPSTGDFQPALIDAMQGVIPNAVCHRENVHKAHLQGQVAEQMTSGDAPSSTAVAKPRRRDRQRRKEREIAEVDQALNRHLTMLARSSHHRADSESPIGQTAKTYESPPSKVAPLAAELLRAPFVLPIDRQSPDSNELLSRCASASPILFAYLPLSPDSKSQVVGGGAWKDKTISHLYIKNSLEMVNSPAGALGDSNSPSKKCGSNKVPVYKQQSRLESKSVVQSSGLPESRDRGRSSPYNFTEYDFEASKPNSAVHSLVTSNNGCAPVSSPSLKGRSDTQERLIDDQVKQKLLNISTLHPELRSAIGAAEVDTQGSSHPRLILRIPKECLNEANSQPVLGQEERPRKRRRAKKKETNLEDLIAPTVAAQREAHALKTTATSSCPATLLPLGQVGHGVPSANLVDSRADSSSDSGIMCDSKEESPAFSGGQTEGGEPPPNGGGTQPTTGEPLYPFGRPRGVAPEGVPKTPVVYAVNHPMQPANYFGGAFGTVATGQQ